jgi:hypothetical protein
VAVIASLTATNLFSMLPRDGRVSLTLRMVIVKDG